MRCSCIGCCSLFFLCQTFFIFIRVYVNRIGCFGRWSVARFLFILFNFNALNDQTAHTIKVKERKFSFIITIIISFFCRNGFFCCYYCCIIIFFFFFICVYFFASRIYAKRKFMINSRTYKTITKSVFIFFILLYTVSFCLASFISIFHKLWM